MLIRQVKRHVLGSFLLMPFKIDYVEYETAAGILHRELTQEPGQGYEI